MCKMSTHVRMLTVKKFDKEKGVVVFEATEALKGKDSKVMSFRQRLRLDAKGVKPILDWLEESKPAVLFTIEGGNIACGYVFIDDLCYSVDYNFPGEFWAMIRVDPELSACYFGKAEPLRAIVKDLLAGKDVAVPTKEPTVKYDKEKRAKEVNEVLIPNRKND
jgi:hypothetical protein